MQIKRINLNFSCHHFKLLASAIDTARFSLCCTTPFLPITVGSKSRKTARGMYRFALDTEKNVSKELSLSFSFSFSKTPSGCILCS